MKDLNYYIKQVRKKFPNYTESQILSAAQSAYESDPESTYKKPKVTSGAPKPTFDTSSEDDGVSGILLGFGTEGVAVPARMASYVVGLMKTNPKAYANLKNAVKSATGRTYNDPTQLGSWVARLAENMYMSNDPIVKNLSIEDFVRSSAKFRTSTSEDGVKADLSRSVYQYSPEQIDADINDVAQKVLGRAIVDADKSADWYQDLTKGLNKMIAGGTTTTTKLVKNKKTGKLEQVTTQIPEFTKEKAAQTIESAVTAADPESLERKQRVDFTQWLFSQVGGQG